MLGIRSATSCDLRGSADGHAGVVERERPDQPGDADPDPAAPESVDNTTPDEDGGWERDPESVG